MIYFFKFIIKVSRNTFMCLFYMHKEVLFFSILLKHVKKHYKTDKIGSIMEKLKIKTLRNWIKWQQLKMSQN